MQVNFVRFEKTKPKFEGLNTDPEKTEFIGHFFGNDVYLDKHNEEYGVLKIYAKDGDAPGSYASLEITKVLRELWESDSDMQAYLLSDSPNYHKAMLWALAFMGCKFLYRPN